MAEHASISRAAEACAITQPALSERLKRIEHSLDVELFEVGAKVDVIGTSIGRGFQGVVKRHGFSGGPASHGSKTGDLPGSIGCSASPSRVLKGRKLPGHMGNERVTVRNLKVVRIDKERNLVVLRGAIPGAVNGLVMIRQIGKGRRES